MREEIIVRLHSCDLTIHEEMGVKRELGMKISIRLPDSLKLTTNPMDIEAFLQHCFNAGFTTYQSKRSKAITQGQKAIK